MQFPFFDPLMGFSMPQILSSLPDDFRQKVLALDIISTRALKPHFAVNTYKDNVIYPSLSSSYFLKTSVILFKLIQLCTNRSKLIAPSFLLSKVLNRVSMNGGLSLYPNATNALLYSFGLIFPLLSASNRSNSPRHAARNPHSPQNSWKPIVPERSLSNMRIIMRTVSGSKEDQSPLTSAAPSSRAESCPLPR